MSNCSMRQLKDKNLCLIVPAQASSRQILNLFCSYKKKKSELGWLWKGIRTTLTNISTRLSAAGALISTFNWTWLRSEKSL